MKSASASLRSQEILDLLSTRPEVSVSELATQFGVTPMTIRRDLDALEKLGRVARTHGGAMLAAPSVAAFSFQARCQTHMAQKRAIAADAAGLVEPGMTIILDTGTTTLEVARTLTGYGGLKVLTSSLAIASALFAQEGVELVLLGGTVSRDRPELYGPLTESNLETFRAGIAFIGADAADKRGLYTDNQATARVTQAIIASAKRVVLVADSSKFGQTSFVHFAGWDAIDTLIVDDSLPGESKRYLREAGTKLSIVSV